MANALLEFLSDPQSYRDMGNNTRNALAGVLTGIAGAPVDMTTMMMRPFGYKTPDSQVFGSSNQLAGLLGADTNSPAYAAGGLLPVGPDSGLKYAGLLGAISKEEKGGEGLLNVAKDYMISHRPMQDAGGASRLHDLTPAYGEDIYGKNALQYFGSGDPRERQVVQQLRELRGKPDAEVTIYRGLPDGVEAKINPGDWVTLHPGVAQDYGANVASMKVKAKDITSWPDSLLEFGYFPSR